MKFSKSGIISRYSLTKHLVRTGILKFEIFPSIFSYILKTVIKVINSYVSVNFETKMNIFRIISGMNDPC